MESMPPWLTVLQVIANFAIVGTFIVYWRQLVAMRGQLTAMREASRSQNVLTIVSFLRADGLRESRKAVMGLTGQPCASWTPEDKEKAEAVCAAFNIAGLAVRHGLVPEDIILDNWGTSIRNCHVACREFVTEARRSHGGPYWEHFDWLAELCSRARNAREGAAEQPDAADGARPG